MEMEILGTLVYDPANKCLFLRHTHPATPGETSPLIWPDGTEPIISGGRRGVDVPGKGEIVDGDRIDAAGGGIDRAALAAIRSPQGCLGSERDRVIAVTQVT